MAAPASYEDTIRTHLAAFYSWLGNLRVDYGGPTDFPDGFPFKSSYPARQNYPILRTMATRERAFATVVDLLVHQGWIDTGTAAEIRKKAGDFAVLPLPIVTYERGDPEIDTTSASVPKRFARSFFNQATLKWESHPWPGTYWLPIRATFWCSKRYTELFMQEWVMSQLGRLGAADREVLIPVTHREPWNTQWQALQLDGIADQSDLEGDPLSRQIRYEISFRLRMLHFRPDVQQAEPVNSVSTPITLAHDGDSSVEVNPFDRAPDVPCSPGASENLYTKYYDGDAIASKWPRTGAATVRAGDTAPEGVRVDTVIRGTVRSVQDRIGVANRPVRIDTTPHDIAILSVALRYRSTAEVGLKLFQRPGDEDPAQWTLARGIVLPATSTWVDLQFFTLVDEPIFTLVFEGRAITADLSFADVSVKHLFSGTRAQPTVGSGLFGTQKHAWNGLDRSSTYLVVALTTASGQFDMRLEDDDVTPEHTITRTFDADNEIGYVDLVQPRAGSVSLSFPSGLAPTATFVQPFSGGLRPRLS